MILDGKKPQKLLKMQNFTVAKQVINSRLHQTASKEHTEMFRRLFGLQSNLWIACLLSIGLMTASCGSSEKETAEAQSQNPNQQPSGGATAVDAAIAKTGLLEQPQEYTGTTTPFRIVSVRSQVEGRLLALNLDVGDTVSQGQNVGQLDDALLVTALRKQKQN